MAFKTKYIIFKTLTNPDFEINKNYASYGIKCYRQGVLLSSIEDISTHYSKVAKLARLFNRKRLDPVHFFDAVEDSLV